MKMAMVFGVYFIQKGELGLRIEGRVKLRQAERKKFNQKIN